MLAVLVLKQLRNQTRTDPDNLCLPEALWVERLLLVWASEGYSLGSRESFLKSGPIHIYTSVVIWQVRAQSGCYWMRGHGVHSSLSIVMTFMSQILHRHPCLHENHISDLAQHPSSPKPRGPWKQVDTSCHTLGSNQLQCIQQNRTRHCLGHI